MALLITEGYATAAPTLRRALSAFDSDALSAGEGLGWGWLASYLASTLWEHEIQYALATRHVELARAAGVLVVLPHTLAQLVGIHMRNGELDTAVALMQEIDAAVEATGSEALLHLALALAAYQRREDEARALIEAGTKHVRFRGSGIGLVVVQWASALLYNGLGRYQDALRAGLYAHEHPEPIGKPPWTLPELIEAAARSGAPGQATDALALLSEMARVSGTDWALGLAARSRALVSDGEEAERLYQRDGCPGVRRPRRARAAGHRETARKRTIEASDLLTAQESQIARLARDGLSNPEIGARLFISRRTVEYHLHKVFSKLAISSRSQLDGALGREAGAAPRAGPRAAQA